MVTLLSGTKAPLFTLWFALSLEYKRNVFLKIWMLQKEWLHYSQRGQTSIYHSVKTNMTSSSMFTSTDKRRLCTVFKQSIQLPPSLPRQNISLWTIKGFFGYSKEVTNGNKLKAYDTFITSFQHNPTEWCVAVIYFLKSFNICKIPIINFSLRFFTNMLLFHRSTYHKSFQPKRGSVIYQDHWQLGWVGNI